MIDVHPVPPVAENELLARFILQSNEKKQDGGVTYRLFLPYKRVELSVNRHRQATFDETWAVGHKVALERRKTLYGRADIRASSCRVPPLNVVPNAILPDNPNHADIMGFPDAREEQMSFALKLAATIEGDWIPVPQTDANSPDEEDAEA